MIFMRFGLHVSAERRRMLRDNDDVIRERP